MGEAPGGKRGQFGKELLTLVRIDPLICRELSENAGHFYIEKMGGQLVARSAEKDRAPANPPHCRL
jgi:hypothetical protein